MTKMMGVDVTKLSKGHARPRERHSSASGAAEATAGADAVMTAKRNDSAGMEEMTDEAARG